MIYPITWHVGEDATNDAGAQGDFAPPAKRGRARGANVKTSNESKAAQDTGNNIGGKGDVHDDNENDTNLITDPSSDAMAVSQGGGKGKGKGRGKHTAK